MTSWVLALMLSALPLLAEAQESSGSSDGRADRPPPYEETVEVVGVTPIDGVGLDKNKVPANVQVLTAAELTAAPDPVSALAAKTASIHVSEAQGGAFQPDVLFRGFTASPLLGASEGLAVYQDGVRINEAFGDTVNWDALPGAAIASMTLMPGSNALFGLNALGGALSVRTKDGFAFPGGRAAVTTGSFGRHQVQAESGGHGSSTAYYVAGSLVDESGWREFSPSTTRQIFGDVAWQGAASRANVSVTAASNDLTGNGPAPVLLLEQDGSAVFTHPDRTDHDSLLVTARGQRVTGQAAVEAVAYVRTSRLHTFNGDAAEDDGEEDDDIDDAAQCFDGVNNISTTRGRGAGASAQLTRTAPLFGRDNHVIAGGGLDTASTRFRFGSELATLTPDRGTVGSGEFDPGELVDLRARTTTASAFFTDTWSPAPRVHVSASARVNFTSVRLRDQIGTALSGDHEFRRINPAAGLTYQLHPRVNLYAGYTQSSRVPTPVELTCADPEDPCRLPNAFVSDPPLDQIVAGTWEAGARGTIGHAAWTVSGFQTTAADDIIFVSSGRQRGEGHFENIARTHRRGIEASFEYAPGKRLSAFGAYTLQRATFGTDLRIASPHHPLAQGGEIAVASGDWLPNVPAHSGKAGLALRFGSGLDVGADVRMQSGQYMRGDEANLLERVPGFAVVDARAAQRITRRLTLVVRAQNLFDAEYTTFGVLGNAALLGDRFAADPRFYSPGAPRSAWVGVEAHF
jgi:outer membrane receptor protein involved in Fe transport